MLGLVASVALDGANFAYDRLYTYAVPPELQKKALVGCRVLIPFGKGNSKKQGIIFHIKEAEIKGLKKIMSLLDQKPILNEESVKICEYLKESVFCTYYDAVHIMLPAGLNYKMVNYYSANEEFSSRELLSDTESQLYDYLYKKGEKAENTILADLGIDVGIINEMVSKEAIIKSVNPKRKLGDATQKWVRISEETDYSVLKLTPRQKEVLNLLETVGAVSVKEICYFTGVTVSVIDNLIKKQILIPFEKQVFRTPKRLENPNKTEIVLTDEQRTAFEGLLKDYKSEKGETALLYGITGSGKTQVYLKLADSVLEEGRGVIVMVPEISLTPQLISIFTSRYGNKISVFHSAMSMGQRMDEWQRIKEGKSLIAIGTRSAIFAPFSNLGLIIIDEEQEHTYKSEKTPRFHTRDVARFRTAYHKGLLCLGSATPSIESFTCGKSGKYSLYTMKSRYGSAVLPEVETVDMRQEILSGNTGVFSRSLYESVKEALDGGHQAIILLNRRGHNTYISCPSCGYVATCPNCSVSLTYHSANKRLMCHYCGYSEPQPSKCPECSGEYMKFLGLGTQKAQEEIANLFPNAKILRLDADSTTTRDSYSNYLSAFSKGEYDILLGTQMVAKGLDFPNVTIVGVLGADSAMYSEDYRSFERTFSLLTQVIGRAGRGENSGKAIVQTVNPDSNLIELARRQDYDTFYNEEILTRKLMIYPPYCDICVVSARSMSRNIAEDTVKQIFDNIKNLLKDEYADIKLIILGPSPCMIPKVNNKYRFRMIIKCKNNAKLRQLLKKAIDIKLSMDATVSVDFNPETVN